MIIRVLYRQPFRSRRRIERGVGRDKGERRNSARRAKRVDFALLGELHRIIASQAMRFG